MHKIKSHKTVEQIAKKHRMDVSFVMNQLKMGIPIEHEHTKDKDLATDIALQHLEEIPDYYTRLKKMEASAKKEHSKFKDVKEHCGCEYDALEELESGLKKLNDTSYTSIDKLMRRIMEKHDMSAKQLHNAFVDKNGKTPDDWIKHLKEGTLHHWFKGSKSKNGKPGWVQADGSPCANEPGETKTPKCFSSARLRSLKKKGKKGESLIASAVRRKRKKDKGQQAKSGGAKPTMVSTFARGKKDPNYVKAEPEIKEEMNINEARKDKPGKGSGTKDSCYYKVKSRYDVWPSAYASGALVKCRRVGADNWGTKSEAAEMIRYCPKCQKDETRSECKYGPKYWDMFSLPSSLSSVAMSNPHYHANSPHPGNIPEERDHEHSMIRSELSTVEKALKKIRERVKGEGNVEAWVQSKITKAADYLDTAADYLESGEHDVDEACWSGYTQKGMKKKNGRLVPNCVKEVYSNWREELVVEGWQEKIKGMTPAEIEDLKKSNPGAAEKINSMVKRVNSATPNPVGSGAQLPTNISKPSQQRSRQQPQTGSSGQSYNDRMADARRMSDERINAARARRAARAARPSGLGGIVRGLSKSKNSKLKALGALATGIAGIAGLMSARKPQNEEYSNWRSDFSLSEDWQKVNRKDKTDGLSQAAVNAYRRENPGSKLQTAVTEKNPSGKRAKRRANFCRRMSGMKSKLTSSKTARDPDSRINKALRRWNCN